LSSHPDPHPLRRKKITALLEAGTTVVSDRYYHSGMVYSVAKGNPLLAMPWARAPERGLPRPDLVVFLDLEPEAAAARGGWGDEKYEKAEMQLRVRELFRALAGLGKDEVGGVEVEEHGDLEVVDAGGSVEAVAEGIWALVKKRVGEVADGTVGAVRTVR
jgi:dTMP kinase